MLIIVTPPTTLKQQMNIEIFAKYINSEIKTKSNILEIDQTMEFLLNRFKSQGHAVVGIDASHAMCKPALNIGIDCIQGYFNEQTFKKVLSKYGLIDVIIANNVFNHANDASFLELASKLLNKNGITFLKFLHGWK